MHINLRQMYATIYKTSIRCNEKKTSSRTDYFTIKFALEQCINYLFNSIIELCRASVFRILILHFIDISDQINTLKKPKFIFLKIDNNLHLIKIENIRDIC